MINSYESSKSRSVLTEVYTQKRGTCVTVIILGIIIGIFAFAYITFGNETTMDTHRVNNTLRLTNIIIQHGQTSRKFSISDDTYKNDSQQQFSLGELSKKGKQNMYSLGKFFRERYSGFLPDIYFSSDIQVISSNSDICLMSAAVLLAGLYPPHKFQIWNPHILWQPIPVKGISSEIDKMIDVTQKCPRLVEKISEIELAMHNDDINLKELYNYLIKNTGMEIKNLTTILLLYNLLYVQEKSGLTLPEWTEHVYPEKLLNYAIKALEIETVDTEISRLSTGVLLEKITLDMVKKNTSNLQTKMFLYSAHEKSIVNLFRILNKKRALVKPDFSSSLIIELHEINEQNIVQVFYLEKVGKLPSLVNITECGNPCLLENFVKYVEFFIAPNWEKACLT